MIEAMPEEGVEFFDVECGISESDFCEAIWKGVGEIGGEDV